MVCEQFEARLMEYGEGGLAAADHAAVEAHLAECAACRELAGALRELDA
jgi:anti-sigma factor RsiW